MGGLEGVGCGVAQAMARLMTSDQALKIAVKIWPQRPLACGEYLGGMCRVEVVKRGGPWLTLAEGATWEDLFREASKRVTVQQVLL